MLCPKEFSVLEESILNQFHQFIDFIVEYPTWETHPWLEVRRK